MKRRIAKKMQKNLINKKALQYIIAHSALCKHAIRELDLAGYKGSKNCINQWMREQVLEAVAVFASHGNSGSSAPFEINIVKKLCSFQTISPLTFADNEWYFCYHSDKYNVNIYQNKRRPDFFKEVDVNGNIKIHTNDSYSKKVVRRKRYRQDDIVNVESSTYWNGRFWLMKDDVCTGKFLVGDYLYSWDVANANYTPRDMIYIPCTEIEVRPNDWEMFVDEEDVDYKIFTAYYDIETVFVPELQGKNIIDITAEEFENAYNNYIKR